MTFKGTISVIAASALVLTFVAPAHATQGTDSEHESLTLDAMTSVAPEVLEEAVGQVADGPVVLEEKTSDTSIVVRSDPEAGIDVSVGDTEITIGLPNAGVASSAEEIGAGLVAFDNQDGSSTVPIVRDGGELQIVTVIAEEDAPERYEYQLELSQGVHLELLPDGRAVVVDSADEIVVGLFEKPWARDAEGADVPTYFTVEGSTLVQTVEHAGASYPVLADPIWIPALGLVARWTAHALAQQAARNISTAAIRAALQEGRRVAGNQAGTSVFSHNGVRVIVNNRTGAIITVTRYVGGGGGGV